MSLNSDLYQPEDDLRQQVLLWNAARMLTLGALTRLGYNRNRYENDQSTEFLKDDSASVTEELHVNLQIFRSLAAKISENPDADYLPERMAACLVLSQKIHNLLYMLHHNLMQHDQPEIFADILPEIDRLLLNWDLTREEILDADQLQKASVIPDAELIENDIKTTLKIQDFISRNV